MQAKDLAFYLENYYPSFKEQALYGRYITLSSIEPLIKRLRSKYTTIEAGLSFQERKIYQVRMGSGKRKILIWSQMHGNESTGTKALFDLINFLEKDTEGFASTILQECSLVLIPMLNPDGAAVYTRVDSQGIDLNRDAVDLKAPESVILRTIVDNFNPKFCFNLHDQRTIFSVGSEKRPATLSFLAPSEDEERTLTQGRKETMSVIADMNAIMQKLIPGQVGRYTDEFYPTATGDNFQKAGHNTILIEAGHYINDYEREYTRKFNFIALVIGIYTIATNDHYSNYAPYFDIPNNEKFFLDGIYKNVFLEDENKLTDIGILFKETLRDHKLFFKPTVDKTGDLSSYNANTVTDYKCKKVTSKEDFEIQIQK